MHVIEQGSIFCPHRRPKRSMFKFASSMSFYGTFAAALLLTLWAPACPGQTNSSEMFCIDLSKYYNTQLTNTLESPLSVKENNLATMPTGRQVFGAVPFVVGGVLQLSGK